MNLREEAGVVGITRVEARRTAGRRILCGSRIAAHAPGPRAQSPAITSVAIFSTWSLVKGFSR